MSSAGLFTDHMAFLSPNQPRQKESMRLISVWTIFYTSCKPATRTNIAV